MRGQGGIYEGVISTYREESSVPVRAVVAQPEVSVRSEASHGWDSAYRVSDAAPSSWKESFVQNSFRETPEWVRHVILNSCLKSNLFRDAATSPKLDRLSHLFIEADLRVLNRKSDLLSAMKFSPALSSAPLFDETVHADENDFVDCGAFLAYACCASVVYFESCCHRFYVCFRFFPV